MDEPNQKYQDSRKVILEEIISAIDHWLFYWSKGKINQKVGACIQRAAMKEVAFMRYLDDNFLCMDDLRIEANKQLILYGFSSIPVPVYVEPDLPKATFDWVSIPFPDFTKGFRISTSTRREELEAMTFGEISKEYDKATKKVLKQEWIDYILESEKDYGDGSE